MSSTASVTVLLALATAPLIGGPGRAGHLPPLTAKYRIDQTLNQEIDATGAGAGKRRPAGSAAKVPARWHGTTGAGLPAMSMPRPGLKRPISPVRLRVPSGTSR